MILSSFCLLSFFSRLQIDSFPPLPTLAPTPSKFTASLPPLPPPRSFPIFLLVQQYKMQCSTFDWEFSVSVRNDDDRRLQTAPDHHSHRKPR